MYLQGEVRRREKNQGHLLILRPLNPMRTSKDLEGKEGRPML